MSEMPDRHSKRRGFMPNETTLRETALQEFRDLIESLLVRLDGAHDGRFPWGPAQIAEIERKLREIRQLVG
jgi:hypothetical protein